MTKASAAQKSRRAREAAYNSFVDDLKDRIDSWSGRLSPLQAEKALAEISEYALQQLEFVPGKAWRNRRRFMSVSK